MDASLGGRFPRTIVYERAETFGLTDSGLQKHSLTQILEENSVEAE